MDFNRSADAIIDAIFRPIAGRSNLRDLAVPAADEKRIPSLKSLSVVGQMVSTQHHHAEHIGMMLFTAIHARTPEQTPYHHLVIPDLTTDARESIRTKFGLRAGNLSLEHYGPCIDLDVTRTVLMRLSDAQKPARYLH